MAVKQNSSNQTFNNNADGFDIAGGTTPRKLSVTGADIGMTGSGTNVHTFPSVSSNLSAGLVPVAVKTTNYTAAPYDFIPADTTSGAVTITLPTAPANGTRIGTKIVTLGAGNLVTISRGGTTDVFNKTGGSTSVTLTYLNQGVQFQYYNGIWYGVAADIGLTALDTRYQSLLTLTTTGSSGPSTLSAGTLNIPQYGGGSGGSGITRSVLPITAAATAGATALTDYVYSWSGSTAYLLTMPTAVSNTNRYTIKNKSTINQSIAFNGSQSADGSTSLTITPNASVELVSDNTNFMVI